MKELKKRVYNIISEMLDVDEEEISDSSRFVEDFGADSLELMELIMAFEDEFGQEIPDDEAQKLSTVGDAVTYVTSHSK